MIQNETHTLTQEGDRIGRQEIQTMLARITGRAQKETALLIGGIPSAWENRQEQMAQLSLLYPKTTFTLEIRGQRTGSNEPRRREYYRDGLVQVEHPQTGHSPDQCQGPQPGQMETAMPERPTQQGNRRLDQCLLPGPRFRCEGPEAQLSQAEDIHLDDETGGYRLPGELHYAEIQDEEQELLTWGFFCSECLETNGQDAQGKPSLTEVAQERLGRELAAIRGYG